MNKVIVIAALVAAGLGALAIRVVVEGRAALATGEAATDPRDAIAAYEAAARWYLPLAPHVDEAYAHLRELTTKPETELAAWRAIRRAALASASLWTPHASDLADANAAIARLSARDPDAAKGAGDTTAAREAWYRDHLERGVRPGGALAALGIVAWVAGAFVLARKATLHRPALAAIVLGLAVWALGLYFA